MPRRSFSVLPFTQLAPLAACTRKLLWQHAIPTAMTRHTEQSDNTIVTFDKSLLSFRHWADGNLPSLLCNKFATDLTTKLWISPFSAFRRTKIVVNRIQCVELSLYRSLELSLPGANVAGSESSTKVPWNFGSRERSFLRAKVLRSEKARYTLFVDNTYAKCFVTKQVTVTCLRFGFCWPLCAFINYIYLLILTEESCQPSC